MENAKILSRLVTEIGVGANQILAVEKLLADGNTVPFIARYRKEAHGNLDEVQIGKIQDRLGYYKELEERKQTILKSIDDQGKLTDELRGKIQDCLVKSALEDLYQPYKPKRRTRAQVAKEKGFEPLADAIWNGTWKGEGLGEGEAATEEDLQYARDILAERIADIADVRGCVRQAFATQSLVTSKGAGKTTLMRQHVKETFGGVTEAALYVSMDDLWFSTHSFMDLVDWHHRQGGTHLLASMGSGTPSKTRLD